MIRIRGMRLCMFLGVLLLTATTVGAQSGTAFQLTAEDDLLPNAIAVPSAAMDVLRQDPQVLDALDYARLDAADLPQFWFSAAQLPLAENDEHDLVVMGREILRGANVATFWVFRPTGSGYELVLRAPAHTLEALPASSHGLRDLQTLSATANRIHTALFQFDGRQYKLAHDEWRPEP